MSLALLVLAVLILGLMCGSELSLAAFAHPALNRQRLETHTLVRSSLAALLGHVMPFWMTGSALLNLLLLLPYERLSSASWWLAASALILQVLAIVFPWSDRFPSIIGSRNGQCSPCPGIGKRRSIAGICITGSERADSLSHSCYLSSVSAFVDQCATISMEANHRETLTWKHDISPLITTGSSAICARWRWWEWTDPPTGSACRTSVRRASLPPS